jgi:DnaJ-domain-containing protein 1
MEYLSDLDRGYGTTMQQNRKTMEAAAPNRPELASPFVGDFQQLLGDGSEPDPLFFIETWTLGTPAALENFKQRQLMQVGRAEVRSDQGPGNLSDRSFVHTRPFNWSVFVSIHAFVQDNCDPTQSSIDLQTGADGLSNRDEALPMTLDRACTLLGVTATSTLCQIKAAHRHLVIQWHPDRLHNRTEEVRRYATGKMAAINEAYRLVRTDLMQQSA